MKKFVLGVTGGVGAGKSTVLRLLQSEYQAYVIEADAVGRRLEERGQPGYAAVVREFGDGILAPDGEIDRRKLAALVFSDEDALRRLNGLLHPMIYEEIQEEIRRECEKPAGDGPALIAQVSGDDFLALNAQRPGDRFPTLSAQISGDCFTEAKTAKNVRLFVLEAAILFETGFDSCCDATVYVYADEETRIRRLHETRGYSEKKAAGIIANQLKDAQFRKRADYVIENGGSFEETKRQICELMKRGVLFYGDTDMA